MRTASDEYPDRLLCYPDVALWGTSAPIASFPGLTLCIAHSSRGHGEEGMRPRVRKGFKKLKVSLETTIGAGYSLHINSSRGNLRACEMLDFPSLRHKHAGGAFYCFIALCFQVVKSTSLYGVRRGPLGREGRAHSQVMSFLIRGLAWELMSKY